MPYNVCNFFNKYLFNINWIVLQEFGGARVMRGVSEYEVFLI